MMKGKWSRVVVSSEVLFVNAERGILITQEDLVRILQADDKEAVPFGSTELPEPEEIEEPVTGALDFEAIYEIYPRKIGKATGINWLKKHVKTPARFLEVLEACQNYRDFTHREVREEKFILHFSTWVKRWEDWRTQENSKATSPQIKVDELKWR